jgi:hypothetical protein
VPDRCEGPYDLALTGEKGDATQKESNRDASCGIEASEVGNNTRKDSIQGERSSRTQCDAPSNQHCGPLHDQSQDFLTVAATGHDSARQGFRFGSIIAEL